MKNRVFHAEEHIYNLQISLSKLVSLSGNPVLALNMTFHSERNFSRVEICTEQDISC